jgi:DNA-binding transcriptional regulator YiaG
MIIEIGRDLDGGEAHAMRRKESKRDRSEAVQQLETSIGRPLTLADLIKAIREGEEMSRAQFARQLGVSQSHLTDIEEQRKAVSPERAAKFAKVLGYSAEQFVKLALQAEIDRAGLKLRVDVRAA